MDVGVEQIATEYGPGQFEVDIRHANPLKAADDLLTVRDVTRALARRAGLTASFMPKPFEGAAGSGMHVHLLAVGSRGPERHGGERSPQWSLPRGRAFLGGLLRHAPALAGVGAPTVNSYKRPFPGHGPRPTPPTRSGTVRRRPSFPVARGAGSRCAPATTPPIPISTWPRSSRLAPRECTKTPTRPARARDIGHMTPRETAALGIAMLRAPRRRRSIWSRLIPSCARRWTDRLPGVR